VTVTDAKHTKSYKRTRSFQVCNIDRCKYKNNFSKTLQWTSEDDAQLYFHAYDPRQWTGSCSN